MKRRSGAEGAAVATNRPRTRSMDGPDAVARGKAVQASKRRVLGDIGNIQAAAVPSKQAADKGKAPLPQPKARSSAAAKDNAPANAAAAAAPAAVDVPKRVTRSQSRALAQGPTTAQESGDAGSRRGSLQASKQRQPQQRPSAQQQPQPQQQSQQQQQPVQEQQRLVLPPLPDIDGPDKHNPLAECQYVNDIYSYFRHIEPKFRARANYMDSQPDINEKMRAILIDWLVEVHLKFKLMPESLFLTINLIDRYLAVRQVTRKNLQLVGVTAMLVAAKYEEIWAPEVRDFVYISDKAYTRKQILETEKDLLQALDYNLSLPTSYQFLARLLKAANVHYEKELALFVAYSAELCLVDYRMLRYSYSELAAGIMYVAMRAFNKADPYPHNLMCHAQFTKESVLHISKEVVKLVQNAKSSNLQAVVKKYSTTKFCEAAMVPPPLDILSE